MRTWAAALASVVGVSLIPLVVAAALPRDEARLRALTTYLVSFAAGALLGGAFLHLVPSAYAALGPGPTVPALVLAGFVGFFVLERYLWAHDHGADPTPRPMPSRRPRSRLPTLALLNVVGDGLHNLLDGMVIAAAYGVAPALGVATTAAVTLHELPQEIGDFGILLHAGLPRREAVLYNLASATAAIGGALLVLAAGHGVGGATRALVPVAAGGFVYIAASDLVPELRRERSAGTGARQLALLVAGILVMGALTRLE